MAEVHARVARAYGLGLDQTFISLLRDLKTLFLANNERALDQMHAAVRRNLAEGTPPPLTPALMAAVDARFKSIMKSLISIGAGLSQLKEQRDLFEDLVIKVGEPLQTAGFDAVTATAVLDACVRMFPALVPTRAAGGASRQRSLHQACRASSRSCGPSAFSSGPIREQRRRHGYAVRSWEKTPR